MGASEQKRGLTSGGREALATAAAGWRLLRSRGNPPWPGFGDPFNGQAERTSTIVALVEGLQPDAAIETGSFFGFTAARMADFGAPVYTIERDPGLYNVARLRLRGRPNVTVLLGDSAVVLPKIAAEAEIRRPFVYLDAHWGGGLPLATEVDTVLRTWSDCVVVVDDFLVPHDSGYGYDIYDGRALSLEMLSLPPEVAAAYPSLPAAQETGARRGTLYLGQGRGGSLVAGLLESGRLSAPPDGTAQARTDIAEPEMQTRQRI